MVLKVVRGKILETLGLASFPSGWDWVSVMRLELEHRMDAVSFQHVAELSAPADSFSSLQKKPSIPRKI